MFNFKYNILALMQVLISAASILLLTRIFGVSADADAFFVAFSLTSALQLIELMFVEQFLYFYSDLKIKDPGSAPAFYGFALLLSIGIGAVFALLLISCGKPFLAVFAPGLDPGRVAISLKLLGIFSVQLFVYPVCCINERLLNAEMRFSYPYILSVFPMSFMLLGQFYILFSGVNDVAVLPLSYSAGSVFSAVAGLFIVRKIGIPLRFTLYHPVARQFLRNSISMRFGHNINNFMVPLLTNNFLSYFPAGYISYYGYAQKFISAAQSVTAGPAQKILASNIARLFAKNDFSEYYSYVRGYLRSSLVMFTAVSVAAYFCMSPVLILLNPTFTPHDLSYIRFIFAGLFLWSFIMIAESAYTLAVISSKRSRVLIGINLVFIAFYSLQLYLLRDAAGVFSLPLSGALTQCCSFFLFYIYAKKIVSDSNEHGPVNV